MLRRFLNLALWCGTGAFVLSLWHRRHERRALSAALIDEQERLVALRERLREAA